MFYAFLKGLLFLFMILLSLFLILIILLQRGKGGGLVGAFGGAGGSSAFGAKTSDVFLKITIWTAIIWFVTCIGGRFVLDLKSADMIDRVTGGVATTAPAVPATDAAPADAAPADSAPAEAPASDAAN
jgi:preprotein translocase subunit SecG